MLVYHLLPSLSQAIGGILILGFVHYVYCYYILHRSRQKLIHHLRCQPPKKYPHQDPVFGLQEALEALRAAKSKTYLQRIQKLYQEYGTTFASETLLATNVVYTIEPANIQTVLATNFKDYHVGAHRKAAIYPLLGNSIILTDGELWSHSRAMFRPSFARSYVSDLPRFERHAKDLIAAIPRDGSTVNLMELFLLLTADATTDFMFGKSIDSLKHPGTQASNFAKMFQDAQIGCEERWRLGRLANFWPNPKFWRSVKQIHAYIDTYVDTALEFRRTLVAEGKAESPKKLNNDANAVEEPYILLQELAKITDDRDTIREGLLTIFFAGRDTTASLLTNLFFMLAKHPEVWRKLRQEVDGLEGKPPSFQDLKDLKYVRWCMNESLRLHPIVAANSRIAVNDTVIPFGGGADAQSPIFVAKGTIVAFHVSALHRRQDLWGKDAEEFKPERWESEIWQWKYLPFIAGPRKCIGQQFALTEATYTTIRLVQEFESVESRDPRPWIEGLGVTCCSENGAQVGLIPRSSVL